MPSSPTNTSPLKTPQQHYGWQGCLPTDGSGFPYTGFWERGGYYQFSQGLLVERSLDEAYEEPLYLRPGTYYLCEEVRERRVSTDIALSVTSTFVILRTLHPTDQRSVRVGVWPHANVEFSKVENAMEILALAATGLAL